LVEDLPHALPEYPVGLKNTARAIQDELLHKMLLHFVLDFHSMFVDITQFNIAKLTHLGILARFFGYSTCSFTSDDESVTRYQLSQECYMVDTPQRPESLKSTTSISANRTNASGLNKHTSKWRGANLLSNKQELDDQSFA
jgi:hypothetical protein